MTDISKTRKTFTDLNNPQQIRELNRQLEWVWNQLLGGLPAKAISDAGMKKVVSVVENVVAKNIVADEITTNVLKAALAEMMVAKIAIAQIDYAQITDLDAQVAKICDAVIEKAEINYAQIANLESEVAKICEAIISDAEIDYAQISDLEANVARIYDASIANAVIRSAQIADFKAEIARITKGEIDSADISYANIKDMVAGHAIIEDGIGDSLLMKRLYVSSANILGATLGNLVLKGDDGKYYSVCITSDGNISTKEVTVSSGEVNAGTLNDGRQIVETFMNVQELNSQTIRAKEAIIAEIFTRALVAGKITAGEAMIASATIPELYTTSIKAIGDSLDFSAIESINLSIDRKNSIFYREAEPENVVSGDVWNDIVNLKTYLAEGMTGKNTPSFDINEDLCLMYSFADDADLYSFYIGDDGCLMASCAEAAMNSDGTLSVTNSWREISPSELHTSFIDIMKEFIYIKSGGGIRITSGGKINIESNGKLEIESGGAIRIASAGIMEVEAGGNLNINASGALRLKTGSSAEIESGSSLNVHADGNINLQSGANLNVGVDGNVNIGTGGTLDVSSGSAHFNTSDYTLSIMAGDGTEDTVLDFDSESKVMRVDEINAKNVRPYIPDIKSVTATSVGGLDGLANLLASAKFEHVVYVQDYDEYSTEPILFEGCDSTLVEISSASKFRIPPLLFKGVNTNVWIENVSWNCPTSDAVSADSGSICVKGCTVIANNGMVASRHARITWIGSDVTADTVGSCAVDAFRAVDGATIRANGIVPTGALTKSTGGLIESVDVVTGNQSEIPSTEEVTTTLTATYGYYGTESYWNSGELFQGFTNAKGDIFGCMKFTMPSDAESIVSATLTLKAASGIGTGALVNVRVYGSSSAYSDNKNRKPALGTRYINKPSAVAAGQSCSLSATTAATALLNGTAKQLVLHTDETSVMSGKVYSKHYAKFTSAKLKITYRRSV